jgi:hypothetical protein
LKDTDRASEAEPAYLKARDLQEELAADFPRVPIYRKGLAATENNLGLLGIGPAASEAARAGAGPAFLHALKLLEALVTEFPGVPEYRSRLSQTQLNLGTMLETTDPARAEAMLRAAHTQMTALVATYPNVPEYTFALGNASFCLGDLLAHRNELAEARSLLSQALNEHRAALDSNPRSPAYRRALCVTYRDYAEVLKRLGAHAALAGIITALPAVAPDDPDAYRYTAYYLAQCAALAAADPHTPAARREPLQEQYGHGAVATLRHAFEKHLIADPRELANPNLDPIRDRADFQALLHEMKQHFPAAGEAVSAAYSGSQSDSITWPIALMTSRKAISSSLPNGPFARSSCAVSMESTLSHCATQSTVKPNCPARNGTQFGRVLRKAKRAEVQTTTSANRPRFRSSRETTITG